jgi:choline dehydrogenase
MAGNDKNAGETRPMAPANSYDFIVVGAGSAGCVLANRLTASGEHTVLLLEAGGRDSNPWIHIPLGYGKHFTNPKVNWLYANEPDDAVAGRRIPTPRGKVLGGSSSINGLVYIRGQQADYDHWRQFGCAGWSYDDVLPYFMKSEGQQRGPSEYHGADGPLAVSDRKTPHELCEAFIAAAERLGYPRTDDFNGPDNDGFGYLQLTMRNGRRCSAAVAFLRPAEQRPNLTIVTDAHATRILFEGHRAVGIEYSRRGGLESARADREVILSGGAVNSPQLLELSGIGAADRLRAHGIDVVADRPAVGENLQDHFSVRLNYRCTKPITLNDVLANPLRGALELARYAFQRDGYLTIGASAAAGFYRSDPALASPDIQVGLNLFSGDRLGEKLHPFSGFSSAVRLLRPESRGTIHIRSADPLARPEIRSNFLHRESDGRTLARACMMFREIVQTRPLADYVESEYAPGPSVSDAAGMLDYMRRTGATSFHPVGTCRMGADDAAVVDPGLRVNGVERLRVVDASIMPTIVSGNTNAPAIMIGEKAADMILADAAQPLRPRPEPVEGRGSLHPNLSRYPRPSTGSGRGPAGKR